MDYVFCWSLVDNSTDLITSGSCFHIMCISSIELRKSLFGFFKTKFYKFEFIDVKRYAGKTPYYTVNR